jgi:hypothetical protein
VHGHVPSLLDERHALVVKPFGAAEEHDDRGKTCEVSRPGLSLRTRS